MADLSRDEIEYIRTKLDSIDVLANRIYDRSSINSLTQADLRSIVECTRQIKNELKL
jgi:hypothetical protein